MNLYIEWRINHFRDYYNWLEKWKQVEVIKSYFWNIVNNLIWVKHWKEYCELLAWFLIEEWKIKIWSITFEDLVNEIENFILKRKRKSYSQWQRDLLAYLLKKYRNSRS